MYLCTDFSIVSIPLLESHSPDFGDTWSRLLILDPYHSFENNRWMHFSPAVKPRYWIGDNEVTLTTSSTGLWSCVKKDGQLGERRLIMMEWVNHPPSAQRIWQEPNIPEVWQDFKGIEPLGLPQLMNEAECMSKSSWSLWKGLLLVQFF